jgi:hypothetical protein
MMKKIAALLASFALAANAHAAAIALGTQELRLGGGIDVDSAAGTAIAFDAGYGYFVADYFQVGGLFGFSNDDIVSTFSIGGFTEYTFETETEVLPFVGAQLRLINADIDTAFGSESETAGALGLYLGVKFFVTEELAVAIRGLVETATEDIYIDDDEVTNVDVGMDFGLRYFF